jgi:hypothetical protein
MMQALEGIKVSDLPAGVLDQGVLKIKDIGAFERGRL